MMKFDVKEVPVPMGEIVETIILYLCAKLW
jgi:hypothetical protein